MRWVSKFDLRHQRDSNRELSDSERTSYQLCHSSPDETQIVHVVRSSSEALTNSKNMSLRISLILKIRRGLNSSNQYESHHSYKQREAQAKYCDRKTRLDYNFPIEDR